MLVRIPNSTIRKKIVDQEIWHIGNSLFYVAQWSANLAVKTPTFTSRPLWAHVRGIPFDLYTQAGLSRVADLLGLPVEVHEFTRRMVNLDVAHLKVKVDCTKPLPSTAEIERENGEVITLSIDYPWIPPTCPCCKEMGHLETLCPNSRWTPKPIPKTSTTKTSTTKTSSSKSIIPESTIPNPITESTNPKPTSHEPTTLISIPEFTIQKSNTSETIPITISETTIPQATIPESTIQILTTDTTVQNPQLTIPTLSQTCPPHSSSPVILVSDPSSQVPSNILTYTPTKSSLVSNPASSPSSGTELIFDESVSDLSLIPQNRVTHVIALQAPPKARPTTIKSYKKSKASLPTAPEVESPNSFSCLAELDQVIDPNLSKEPLCNKVDPSIINHPATTLTVGSFLPLREFQS